MKIMISSNSPLGTSGYSTQAAGMMRAFQAMGHEVSFYAWFGLESGQLNLNGVRIIPRLTAAHNFGADAYFAAEMVGAQVLVTLQDAWVLPEEFGEECRKRGITWVAYFPVDGTPVPPSVVSRVKDAAYRVVFSQFAVEEMAAAGLDCTYIPHGIDTAVFKPPANRAEMRRRGGAADTFLVVMVAANIGYPSRKSFPEALAAFGRFHERHPNSLLYLHTNKYPTSKGSGYNLEQLAYQLGIPGTAVRFVDQLQYQVGLPPQAVAEIYGVADVLLMPSMGEGFGLPIAEAQACGCPVIVQDCTSMSELCVNGVAIEPLQPFYTFQKHFQYTADIGRIDDALEQIYQGAVDVRQSMSDKVVQFFHDNYGWDVVGGMWRDFLDSIAERPSSLADYLEAELGEEAYAPA